jgi:hypothetical protein
MANMKIDDMKVAIISEELLRANSPITPGTAISEFVPYLPVVQLMYIEPVLGIALTEELKTQVSTNSLTPLNHALILEIAPPLAYFVAYQAIPFHWKDIVKRGVSIKESENSKGVAMDDLVQLRNWLRADSEMLLKQLVAYLYEHWESYPLWYPERDE